MRTSTKYLNLVLIFILTACGLLNDHTPTCTELTSAQAQISRTFTERDFIEWIAKTYSVNPSEIEVTRLPERSISHYSWEVGKYKYRADLQNKEFVSFGFFNPQSEVSLGNLVKCFGNPTLYRATYDKELPSGNKLVFELTVPDQGVFAMTYEHNVSGSPFPIIISQDFSIDDVSILTPGSPEEVVKGVYGDSYKDILTKMKPWPKDSEVIEVDISPNVLISP